MSALSSICCGGVGKPLTPGRSISKQIDDAINVDRRKQRRLIKLLLLGAGEAGKSTILKQMKIIHGQGFDETERKRHVRSIHSNILESINSLTKAMDQKNIRFENPDNLDRTAILREMDPFDQQLFLTPEQLTIIEFVWKDRGVQECYEDRKDFHLSDSTKYFMDCLDVIRQPDYVPNDDHILHVRVRTTSIQEYPFVIGKATFLLVDVGGQKNERRKWIHCFDNIASILFIASLSEYDQRLLEDSRCNRMQESKDLFNILIQDQWLKRCGIILFLNKTDLFKEKIVRSHLADYFPDYRGAPRSVEQGQDFILNLYHSCNSEASREIYTHYTCATDTEGIRFVFNAVRVHILDRALIDVSPF